MPPSPQEKPVGNDENPTLLDANQSSPMSHQEDPSSVVGVENEVYSWLNDRPFDALFEAALDGMLIANDRGGCIAANSAACTLLGKPREQLVGQPIADCLPPELSFERAVQDRQQQRQVRGELFGVSGDDGDREVESVIVPHFLPYCHLVVLRDVTQEKQFERQLSQTTAELQAANQQLHTHQQKYQTLFETLPIGVCITDAEGQILEANPVSKQILGISTVAQAQINDSEPTWQVIRPDGNSMPVEDYVTVRALKENRLVEGEQGLVHSDGSTCWLRVSATPIPLKPYGIVIVYTDITELKQSELSLRESEARFAATFQSSPDAIVITQISDGKILDANPQFAQVSGYPLSEAIGQTTLGLQIWANPAERKIMVDALRTRSKMRNEEFAFRRKSGEVIVSLVSSEVIEVDGQACALSVVQDISERKKAEEALRQREKLLDLFFSQSLDGFFFMMLDEPIEWNDRVNQEAVLDYVFTHQRITRANDALLAQYGATRDQFLGLTPAGAFAHDLAHARELWRNFLNQGHLHLETDQRKFDGTPIVIEGDYVCIYDEQGRITGHFGVQRDITELKQAAIQQTELYKQVQQLNSNLEQQVQERTKELRRALDFEMLLQRITEQVRDSLDEDQILETVVRELGQELQLECCDTGIYNADLTTSTIVHEFTQSLPSVKGMTFLISEAFHSEIYPFLFQGQILQFCDRITSLRDYRDPLAILVCPVLDDQRALGDLWLYKQGTFGHSEVRLVQQVANQCAIALRQSRLYQTAQDQVQELERLNQLKDDFLSTVSHELRTPMSNIKMATQMLEISLNRLGVLNDPAASINRYFNVLREQGQREIDLINDLLDLTRLDVETTSLDFISINLQDYIPRLATSFIERARQQQQQFVIQLPPDLPPLTTYLPYLERILAELMQNACKYTPKEETIILSAKATFDCLEIEVINSGVEIPPVEYDRIFEKFYRILKHDPWKYGGTGLGLALVKTMLKRLGGTITVSSSPQPPITMFTLRFPNA